MIREMRAGDVIQVVDLGFDMHQESQFKNMEFSDALAQDFVIRHIADDKYRCAYVAEHNGAVIGFLLANLQNTYFGQNKIATDSALYVEPKHRNAGYADKLVEAYINWAKAQGAVRIYLSSSTGIDPDKFRRFGGRLGFEQIGILMKQEV